LTTVAIICWRPGGQNDDCLFGCQVEQQFHPGIRVGPPLPGSAGALECHIDSSDAARAAEGGLMSAQFESMIERMDSILVEVGEAAFALLDGAALLAQFSRHRVMAVS